MKKIIVMTVAIALLLSLMPAMALAAAGDNHIDGSWVGKELADGTVSVDGYIGVLSGAVTIPSTISGYAVTAIGGSVFSGKTGITAITIPEGVTDIPMGAFAGCSALAGVTLPSTLETVGEAAFIYCDALESITLPSGVVSIGDDAFRGCDLLSSITLPDTLTTIGANAFEDCAALHSVTIPAGMTTIGYYAFYKCGLTSIDIPATVQTIGDSAFVLTTALTSVTLHEGLLTIEQGAFAASGLTSVTIPSTVTSIGDSAFANCTSMTKATILNPSCSLGSSVFRYPMSSGVFGFAGSTAEPYSALYGLSFTPIYKLTFNSKGGSAVPWGYDVAGGSINKPADPTRSGYVFAGWYDNDDYIGIPLTFPYTITESYTLYARWEPIYTVTFDSKGGSAVSSQQVARGDGVTEPADPTLAGNVFGGWFEDEECIDAWDFDTYGVWEPTTLYAKWTELTLASSDADGKIYTDGRVTLTPSVPGGVWTFDSAYFTREDGTFTALKAGTSTITYTVGGVSQSYEVTIEASELPSTGQDFGWVWALCGAAAFVLAAGVLLRRRAVRSR